MLAKREYILVSLILVIGVVMVINTSYSFVNKSFIPPNNSETGTPKIFNFVKSIPNTLVKSTSQPKISTLFQYLMNKELIKKKNSFLQ